MGCDAQFFPPFSLFDLTHFSWNRFCGNGGFGERGDGRFPIEEWRFNRSNFLRT